MASITYYELSNYNNGSLIFKTFDLDGVTYEEHHQEITCWLEELTEQTGELCEEWIVADYEEVPSNFVGEWSIDEAFFEYAEACGEYDEVAVRVFIAYHGSWCKDSFEEAYQGEYDNDVAFVDELLEGTGDMDNIPSWIAIDWERTARDIMMDYHTDENQYFRCL